MIDLRYCQAVKHWVITYEVLWMFCFGWICKLRLKIVCIMHIRLMNMLKVCQARRRDQSLDQQRLFAAGLNLLTKRDTHATLQNL